VAFRNDILRGVRLFLIAFSVVLIGVWIYRMLRAPADVQGAENVPAVYEAAQPEQPAPADAASQAPSEPHGLAVPPPPPVGGKRPAKVASPRYDVPPPPPLQARAGRAAAPSGREFEASEVGALPAAPTVESPDASEVPASKGVGYKSLLEANSNRPVLDLGAPSPAEEPAEKPQKGNRFFRAIGKIFHPGGQKETTTPLTLQPKQ
jgi:hypothetical protein